MIKGFDAAVTTTRWIPRMRAAGIEFVGRYYSFNPRKNLSAEEARALSAAGIRCVAVWEGRGDQAAAFSPAQGTKDAGGALKCAAEVGQPEGSAIYFAVDFDASAVQVQDRIVPYFRAVNAALGKYKVGVYASGLVCTTLGSLNLASHKWTGAVGWRGTREYLNGPYWHIRQHPPSDPYGFGVQIDPDEGRGEYGGFLVGPRSDSDAVPPIARPDSSPIFEADVPVDYGDTPTLRLGDSGAAVARLQSLLQATGYALGAADGYLSPLTENALVAFQRASGLTPDGVAGPATWARLLA